MSRTARRFYLGFRAYTLHAKLARQAGRYTEAHLALVAALAAYRVYRSNLIA